MNERENLQKEYKGKSRKNRRALWIEILVTCSVALIAICNSNISFKQQAKEYTADVETEYNNLMTSYTRQFDIIYAQVAEKIEDNPDFDEMDSWLKSMDSTWAEAMGSSVIYDGISLTYKGGFARSWSYGDYSNYDPTVRDWYKLADKADGKTAILAPYVTFLDSQETNDGSYLVMSIVKKYNDEIYVDYDIKLVEMEDMLDGKSSTYRNEQLFIFDKDGYILSSNVQDKFSHNILESDTELSPSFCDAVRRAQETPGHYEMAVIDHVPTFVYLDKGGEEHYICMMISFLDVAKHDYLILVVCVLCLVVVEILLYHRNNRNLQEFRNKDERLTALADVSYEGQVYVNLEDFRFYGSEEALSYCGSGTYEELYQLYLTCLTEKSEIEQFEKFLSKEALQKNFNLDYNLEKKRFTVKWHFHGDNKNERIIEVCRLAFLADGKATYGIAYRDVTESAEVLKDALKQAESASMAKGSFLSNMSHEIRTPLNAVIGYVEIALDSGDDIEKIKHCLDNCKTASKHLLQIINDILDMSSIETGKLKIANEEFDLKKEIADITTIFYQNSKIKNIVFETHLEELTEEWVVGDQLRLNQILMNLLSNAVKFTPENGKVELGVHQLRDDEKQVYIQFTVSDTGIGMSKEYMAKLFTPFEQESAATAKKYGGSGLGLSITHNLIALMGGTINVDSKQGEGTTFTVTMHFDKSTDHPTFAYTNIDYSHVRALIVDDRQEEGTYVKTMLRRCGVKSDTVTSGADALKRIRSRMSGDYSYDLCILDWNMPDMNGVEVATKIREEFGADIPIIIATAYDITELETEAKKAGVNKVVSKPLFQSTIFDLLVSAFGKYTPVEESTDKKRIDMSGVHIILAEDNEMNMDIACTVLEKAGIKIDRAVNGREAYDLFVNAPAKTYDLILMDVQMPVMDGYEATKQIRQCNHPEAQTIPVIAMTANAFAEDVTEALANGMNAHISKPIDNDKLFAVMEKYSR